VKRNYFLLVLSLLFCLFIYLFYRTEKTVITQFFISLVTFDEFIETRRSVTTTIPLNEFIIYSLPEGLWVFCITLTSQSLFIKIREREISLLFAPLLASIGLELFQLLQLTQGRFDVLDIVVSLFFWAIAAYLIKPKPVRQNILQPFTKRSFICLISYSIVYLAHVWK
jgi:hypothetical protein